MEARRIEGDLWDFGTTLADSGVDRLCLRYIGEDSFDFHELVWEKNIEGKWVRYKTPSPREFLCSDGSSWIIELHSFDAVNGRAIVKVGEMSKPDQNGASHVNYTWQSVNFLQSVKPEILQNCKDPFEPYDG